jgi:hypothetical protein
MLAVELKRLVNAETHRHELLRSRLSTAFLATAAVYLVGAVVMYFIERHGPDTQIHSFGDAAFFVAVQLLTISSQLRNPVTAAGRVVDVILELYALVVVTTLAGSFAAFFHAADHPLGK